MKNLVAIIFFICFPMFLLGQTISDCHVFYYKPINNGMLSSYLFRGETVVHGWFNVEGKDWDANQYNNYLTEWVKNHENLKYGDYGGAYSVLTFFENYGDRVIYKFERTFLHTGNQIHTFYYAFSKDKKVLYAEAVSLEEARNTQLSFEKATLEKLVEIQNQYNIAWRQGKYRIDPFATGYNVPNGGNGGNGSNNNGTISSSSSSQHWCGVCKGTGSMTKAWYMNSNYETYCNICKQKFYHGHSHVTCTSCNGKGYW